MRTRPVLAVVMAASALAGLTLATPSSATVLGSLCEISGDVEFIDKPKAAPGPVSYKLTGKVTGCLQSPNNGALDETQTGVYQVGGTVTVGGKSYALANGSGTASCAGGTTAGEGVILWDSGEVSVIKFDTVNAARVVTVRGSIADGSASGLKTTTKKYDVGDAFDGPLLLDNVATAECNGGGVPSATFTSRVAIGSYQ